VTADSAKEKPKKSWLKMLLFTILCLFIGGIIVTWMLFGHYAVLFYWNGELNKALVVAKSNSQLGKQRVEAVFNEAKKANVAPDIVMRMYRVYANHLIMEGETDRGNAEFQKAIEIGTPEPPTNYAVADQLTHVYQDRAWSNHTDWLTDRTRDNGAKDQEMSVKVAEKSFGPYHEQTIYKSPGLAVIYADLGQFQKADSLIKHCIEAVETKDSAKQCGPYVYAMLARIRAVEHRNKEAVDAYYKCRELAATEEESGRGWSELLIGLRFNKPAENADYLQTRRLLNKNKFAELDQLAEKSIKNKEHYWNGVWKIDKMIKALEWDRHVDEVRYDQLKLDIGNWLKKNPNSAFARCGLAQLHINRAWAVNNEGDGNSQKFDKLMAEARRTLAELPNIKNLNPQAYVALIRLTIPERKHDELVKLAEAGNKQWPSHLGISTKAYSILSTGYLGREGESHKYLQQRADTLGGAEGDKFYAQVVWYIHNDTDEEVQFEGEESFSWDRVARGFKEIFREFPDDNEARIAFINLAYRADKTDAARRVFDK
jgi:hypothetical protein